MPPAHLIVDGMLSGTGIRDAVRGGYVEPDRIGLPSELRDRIADWLSRYADEFYRGYRRRDVVDALDREGTGLARDVQRYVPAAKVTYFSDALMGEIRS